MVAVIYGGKRIDVPCAALSTVAQLKCEIARCCGIPVAEQKLLAAGKQLDDEAVCPAGKTVMLMKKPAARTTVTLRDTRGRVVSGVEVAPSDSVESVLALAQKALQVDEEGCFALFYETTKTLLRSDLRLADYHLGNDATLWLVPKASSLEAAARAAASARQTAAPKMPSLAVPGTEAAWASTDAPSAARLEVMVGGKPLVMNFATADGMPLPPSLAQLAAGGGPGALCELLKKAGAPPHVLEAVAGGADADAGGVGGAGGAGAAAAHAPAEAAAARPAVAALPPQQVPKTLRTGLMGGSAARGDVLEAAIMLERMEAAAAAAGVAAAGAGAAASADDLEAAYEQRCARVVSTLQAAAAPAAAKPAAAARKEEEAWGGGLKKGLRKGFLSAPPRARRAPKRAQEAAPAAPPATSAAAAAAAEPSVAAGSPTIATEPPAVDAPRSVPEAAKRRKELLQCATCACRLPMATAELCCRCRCGGLYCAAHRHAHCCAAAATLKEQQRRQLTAANPKLEAVKLEAM